jgi:hypothetical protein
MEYQFALTSLVATQLNPLLLEACQLLSQEGALRVTTRQLVEHLLQ